MISSRMSPVAFSLRCSSDCHFLPVFAEGNVVFFNGVSLISESTVMSRISKIDHSETGPSKSAVIHFEKPSAAKTALMVRLSFAFSHSLSCSAVTQLNGSLLDGGALNVHSDIVHPDEDDSETTHIPGAPLDQSYKPRAGSKRFSYSRKLTMTGGCLVAAEYLAKGYKLSDNILQRAIQLDGEFSVVLCHFRE